MGIYEKLCNISEKLLRIKPDQKTLDDIQEAIDIAHLNITPAGAASFSILIPLVSALFGSLFAYIVFQSIFFMLIFLVGTASIINLKLSVNKAQVPFNITTAMIIPTVGSIHNHPVQ